MGEVGYEAGPPFGKIVYTSLDYDFLTCSKTGRPADGLAPVLVSDDGPVAARDSTISVEQNSALE